MKWEIHECDDKRTWPYDDEVKIRYPDHWDEDGEPDAYIVIGYRVFKKYAELLRAAPEMLAVLEKVLVGLDGGHLDNCDCLAKSPGTSCENCELLDEVDAIVQKAKSKP
jgi:hypothetical protein